MGKSGVASAHVYMCGECNGDTRHQSRALAALLLSARARNPLYMKGVVVGGWLDKTLPPNPNKSRSIRYFAN